MMKEIIEIILILTSIWVSLIVVGSRIAVLIYKINKNENISHPSK